MKAFTVAIAGAILSVAEAAPRLTIEKNARQTLKGWGTTISPLDWDGRSVLRDGFVLRRILEGSGLTVGRIPLGTGGLYIDGVGVNRERARAFLRPQIEMLERGGIRDYFLSFIVPPSVMRVFRSDEARIEFEANSLRVERESDYIKYIVDIVKIIDADAGRPPSAVSFQYQPDLPPAAPFGSTAAPGALYSPDQWARVAAALREALDAARFPMVGVTGPESSTPRWTAEALAAARRTSADSVISTFAITAGTLGDADPWRGALDAERLAGDLAIAYRPNPLCRDDRELLVDCFQALCSHLVELRASFWFWPQAFDWNRSPQALAYGRDATYSGFTPALRQFWKLAPADSVVHRVVDADTGAMVRQSVALANGARWTLVYVNSTQTSAHLICRFWLGRFF